MNTSTTTSVLQRLRSLAPQRDNITFNEALRIAELQATTLGEAIGVDPTDISELHIAGLPRITVIRENLPVSGTSHWNGREWVIAIAGADSLVRQRFTMLHEFKHIVDHGQAGLLYRGGRTKTGQQQAELAADYFAGCALVPKRQLKSEWGNGIQRVPDLAAHFGVSEQAIGVRLSQTGLNVIADSEPNPRCARPIATPRSSNQRFRTTTPGYQQRRYA